MSKSHDNENAREHSFSSFLLAKGLLCPHCKRAVRIEDLYLHLRGSSFSITCDGCDNTLIAYHE
ncbi:hypothetical protein [Bradyrhizobium sp. AZCC 2289]|jgi:hypothetical protein|uniref:hypothetical protein n=1 Tax=Bradyrhizobium sp. AZCC 2289 TaxID=3117026 RepID=UPI002FF2A688